MQALISEVEDCIAREAPERRAAALRRLTDLFVQDAARLRDEHVELFDLVLAKLAAAIEVRSRAELAERLAEVPNAPAEVIRSLARDEIAVARPVLARSRRLSDEDLVAVAVAKGRDHMLAISERPELAEPVTDALVRSGDRVVAHAVAGNPSARFSEAGLTALVARSGADEALQALLGERSDLPDGPLRQLLGLARETARRRADGPPPVERPQPRKPAEPAFPRRDYAAALEAVRELGGRRPLTEADLVGFADAGEVEAVVCALSAMADLPLAAAERVFDGDAADHLLLVAKAQGWSWPTLKALLARRNPETAAPRHLKRAAETFDQLSVATAERVLQYLRGRDAGAAARR